MATAVTKIGGEGYVGSGQVFTSAAIPVATNDVSAGHLPGDIVVNAAGPAVYICISNAVGAAVWKTFTVT